MSGVSEVSGVSGVSGSHARAEQGGKWTWNLLLQVRPSLEMEYHYLHPSMTWEGDRGARGISTLSPLNLHNAR